MGLRDKLPEVPEDIDVIYDFGGYPDARIIDAARIADTVIVPIIWTPAKTSAVVLMVV